MSNDKMRAEFEAKADIDPKWFEYRDGDGYSLDKIQHDWVLWQAAWQAARAQPAESGLTQVDMGFGKFAVGGCQHPENKVPGIVYLHLRDDVRPLGADTTDVYPEGSQAQSNDIAGLIYFHNAFAIKQTIDVLLELQREHYPAAQPTGEAVAHPLNNDDAAIQLAIEIGAYDCIHSPNGKPELRTWSGDNSAQAKQMTRLAIVKAAVADGKYTAPPAQVPDGWKIVPPTSTHEMWVAADAASRKHRVGNTGAKFDAIYRAMLAAAPQPKGGE